MTDRGPWLPGFFCVPTPGKVGWARPPHPCDRSTPDRWRHVFHHSSSFYLPPILRGPRSSPPHVNTLYFAYGSNLRTAQMQRLCPGHRFLGPARLADYRLAFTLPDEEWQGGVADVLPTPGEHVWGALYDLTSSGLAALDAYEGYDPHGPLKENAYLRRTVTVSTNDGHTHGHVWCYFVRQPHSHVPPSDFYRRALRAGAQERGLPLPYIEALQELLRRQTEC
jgi:gamma-glutamylcyclotransferase